MSGQSILPEQERAFAAMSRLEPRTFQRVGEEWLSSLQAKNSKATRIVDKMPFNYAYLGLLAALFPRAIFIHCQRDLRDVLNLGHAIANKRVPEGIMFPSERFPALERRVVVDDAVDDAVPEVPEDPGEDDPEDEPRRER